ncbi:MAG: hypothetical protein LBN37_03170 [Bacteroidales bacterium]|jgi:hypothetical protein|nr:hypothetical protein [Bacteroidales bacterium]
MYQRENVSTAATYGSAMEQRPFQKRASSKSLMSRGKSINDTSKYNFKKFIPMFMLALAPNAFNSCDKDEVEYTGPYHDTTYTLSNIDNSNVYPPTKIKASADSVQVRNVYIVPVGDFLNFPAINIGKMADYLKPIMEISPKIKGKGNFIFEPGEATLSGDSLWYVQNGWTVNQK